MINLLSLCLFRHHALMTHDSRWSCRSICPWVNLSDMRIRTPRDPHKTAGRSSGGLEDVEDALASPDPESFVRAVLAILNDLYQPGRRLLQEVERTERTSACFKRVLHKFVHGCDVLHQLKSHGDHLNLYRRSINFTCLETSHGGLWHTKSIHRFNRDECTIVSYPMFFPRFFPSSDIFLNLPWERRQRQGLRRCVCIAYGW